MAKENLPLSIILGIFVGMAATLSLQSFLREPLPRWIGYSITVIILSVLFIYLMIETGTTSNSGVEIFRIIIVTAVTFLPFSFQKNIIESEHQLPFWGLILHAMIIGALLVLLGYIDKNLSKEKAITSKVIGFILLIGGGLLLLIAPAGLI